MSEPGLKRGPKWRWSIGTKLIIAFLALAIIPMSVTAYYNLTQGQSAVTELARENLMELSHGTARQIGQLLIENQRASATLAGEPMVAQFLAAAQEERQAMVPRINRILKNYADTHPDYDAPGLLDVNGIVVASLAQILIGKDRSFRDYFQASIKGQPYVSDILVERGTGRPGVFLTNPVISADGKILGINIVWLKGGAIWKIIDDVQTGNRGRAFLVDQDGVIIAHPNRDLLYHSLGELTPEAKATISATIRFGVSKDNKTPLIPKSLGMDDLAAELAATQGSGACRYYSPLDHRDHVVGYSRLEAHPWIVVVDLPETQFLAPLRRLESMAAISVALVGILTLIVSILLVRSITRPIRRLTDAALAVEDNQPFKPSDIADVTSGRDEIAQLGRAFSHMVLALRQELTERQQAEKRMEHLAAVLRAIRNVNQLITREKDRDRLFKGACQNLVETRGYHNAWIALLDEAGELVAIAEAGLDKYFFPLIEQFKRGELPDCGQRALSQEGVIVTQDPPADCPDCPLSVTYGGGTGMTVRLEHEGKVYGLLTVSIPRDFIGDEEEQALFQEVARDIAFALHNLELEEERQRAKEALKEYSERLEEMVEERTKELKDAQEALIRQEKLAILGELAGGVGHELRNPLGVMSNAVFYLKTILDKADEKTGEYLDILSSEIGNANKIVSDLLSFSRTRPAEREKITVAELVAQVLEKQPAPENVEVTTSIASDLPSVFVDPRQIDQVLTNLITNAYQAMPEGGKMTINAQAEKEQVSLSIADTGSGISKENITKLFEPLFTTRARGIGLGLAVSRSLAEANGGSIEVESEEGRGSTFIVVLPTKRNG